MIRRPLNISRRSALLGMGALTLASTRTAFGQSAIGGKKFILIILRGALDGLFAVPPIGDRNLMDYRPDLVDKNAKRLTSDFALHSSLETIHALYQAGDASIVHAVAGPYRDRSHFLAQDLLESGTASDVTSDGWLNRALQFAPQPLSAVSIGPTAPLVLRGDSSTTTWSPSSLPEASEDTLARLQQLYAEDTLLGPALESAIALDSIASGQMGGKARINNFGVAMSAAGRLLTANGGPDIAVVPLGGWDTHAGQSRKLSNLLSQLDDGIALLKKELGPTWDKTAVAVVTEFGRTVRQNGTQGTDHGTAGAAFVLGGAISGGRMEGDWPGLASKNLYEGRDLMPANDLRSVFTALLEKQFGFDPSTLVQKVFPGSSGLTTLDF